MNKKGMFFTLMTMVIISLFILSYTIVFGVEKRKVTQERIESLNEFVLALEEDIPRQIFASGFRMIFIFYKSINNPKHRT